LPVWGRSDESASLNVVEFPNHQTILEHNFKTDRPRFDAAKVIRHFSSGKEAKGIQIENQ